jgi:hypothetical protein
MVVGMRGCVFLFLFFRLSFADLGFGVVVVVGWLVGISFLCV